MDNRVRPGASAQFTGRLHAGRSPTTGRKRRFSTVVLTGKPRPPSGRTHSDHKVLIHLCPGRET